MQGFDDGIRCGCHDFQKGSRRASGGPSVLFPILKRTHADIDGCSKLALREFCAFAHCFDVNGIDGRAAAFEFAGADSFSLPQAFFQVFKEFCIHRFRFHV